MLGFSMITLSLLIAGIFALFFFAVIVTTLQYEKAKRDDRRNLKYSSGEFTWGGDDAQRS
jgi:hypothetical protein